MLWGTPFVKIASNFMVNYYKWLCMVGLPLRYYGELTAARPSFSINLCK